MRIISFGELLWDVINDHEFLGGAPVNFSAASVRLGAEVALVSAVGNDPLGVRSLAAIKALGLSTQFIPMLPGRRTGIARVLSEESGHAAFELNRPAAYDFLEADPRLLKPPAPDWIYFGTLAQTSTANEAALNQLIVAHPTARLFYDINLRDGHWSLALVERLAAHVSVLKLNEHEAEALSHLTQPSAEYSLKAFCGFWSDTHNVNTVCVSLGAQGCAVWYDHELHRFPGYTVQTRDTIGAGDAFSAAFLHGIGRGWSMSRTASFANALGAVVASRRGATPEWEPEECEALISGQNQG